MANSYVYTVNMVAPRVSEDGLILDVNNGDLGDADTSFTYFPLALGGFNAFTMDYGITATTLTWEASNDDPIIADEANELINNANDRTFAGSGNWEADGTGASVAVAAGTLNVTVGNASTGARLEKQFFNGSAASAFDGVGFRGSKEDKRSYTVLLSISLLTAGTVSVLAGTTVIASGLGNGAAQSFTYRCAEHGDKLSVIGTNAAATFSIDNVSVTNVGATWRDVTDFLFSGAFASITATGSLTMATPMSWPRMRVRRLTTAAVNALELRLTRIRI